MSLGWSDDGPPIDLGRALGWSDDGPVDPDPDPVLGWTPEHWTTALLTGAGTVEAHGYARNYGGAQLTGAGQVQAAGYPESYAAATLTGSGLVVAAGWPESYDNATAAGDGTITGTGALAVRGPLLTSGAGSFARPWWARFYDYVLLGPGGGGAGGRSSIGGDGKGGSPGTWISGTIDLGATWLAGNVVVALGTPGTAGPISNQNGGAGAPTTITSPFGNRSAAGGPGGSGINPPLGTDYRGLGPGDYTDFGLTFTGGGTVDKDTDGSTPGGAGAGGSGGVPFVPAKPGRPGGPGFAWGRFRQS